MKTLILILISALLAPRGSGQEQPKETAPVLSAESSAYVIKGKNAWTFVTQNRSFQFVEVPNDQGDLGGKGAALLLLEETYHNERTDGIEGVRGSATVKAWTLHPAQPNELRWTFHETGNEGSVQDRLFRITAWGCCDIPVVYSYYSLVTGQKLYVSNSDLLEIAGGDFPQGKRLVAFGYSGLSQLSQPPVLEYGTDTKLVQRLAVVSSRQYFDTPQLFASIGEKLERSLDLRGSPLTFVIVLHYEDGVELRIPVEADTIRPDKAVLPHGYSLRVLPTPAD